MAIFGHYIPRTALKLLRQYKYQCGPYVTQLESIMNVLWEWTVARLPMSLAPNLITLIGFICASLGFFLIAFFVPTGTEAAPRIVYLLVAVLYFAYQTLDAVDGKQARRTKTSSALGTLFDHGCDVFTAISMALSVAAATQCGTGLLVFLSVTLSSQLVQFVFLWWEYYFHVFFCNPGFAAGVTEAQIVIELIFVGNFMFGPGYWGTVISSWLPKLLQAFVESKMGGPVTARDLLIYFLIVNNLAVAVYTVIIGLQRISGKTKKMEALTQVLGFLLFIVAEMVLYRQAILKYQVPHVLVYLVMIQSYAVVAIRMLLASFCRRRYWPLQWPVYPTFGVAILLQLVPQLSRGVALMAVSAVLIWQTVYTADFLYTSVSDICDTLGIRCFVITAPAEGSKDK